MKRTVGRPKAKNTKVAMTFRFRPEFADLIKKTSFRNRISQARVLEIAMTLHAKEIKL
ncbi:MAG: hypothetical protein KGL39_54475 [Patescibacteria group bacterium]|nr:hypothetical protein [Patescibacteria group bacterium]